MKILMKQKESILPIEPIHIDGYSKIDVNSSDFEQIPVFKNISLPDGVEIYDNDSSQIVFEYNFDVSEQLYVAEKLGRDLIPAICLKFSNLNGNKEDYNPYIAQVNRHIEYENDYDVDDYILNGVKWNGTFHRINIDKNNPKRVKGIAELVNYKWFTYLDLINRNLNINIVVDCSMHENFNTHYISSIGNNLQLIINISYSKCQKRKNTILTGKFDFKNTDFYKESNLGRIVTSPVSRNQYLELINCLSNDYSKKYINNHKFFEINKNFIDKKFRESLINLEISTTHAFRFFVDFEVECIYGDCDEHYKWKGKKHKTKLTKDRSSVTLDPQNNSNLVFSGLLYDKNKKLSGNENFANKVICMYQIVYNISTGQFTMNFTNLHCGRMIVTKPVKVKIYHQRDLYNAGKIDDKIYTKLLQNK